MTKNDDAIELHKMLKGKIEICSRIPPNKIFEDEATDKGILDLIYTPGVAYVAEQIYKDKELAYDYTSKWNNVAIVCDGTRVLGLGNVGPESALTVMEGKSILFKILGNINAYPLCIATQSKEEIIKFVKLIEPNFGAINIEDIESPKVLEIVEILQKEMSIPVFHDDQHGTAAITLAALINALKIVNKRSEKVKVIIAGAGSAGYGIFKVLHKAGFKEIIVVDKRGAIHEDREDTNSLHHINSDNNKDSKQGTISHANAYKAEIASKTNKKNISGNLENVIDGADIFIGTTGNGKILDSKMIKSMNFEPIIFALSNPDPEIAPETAKRAGAKIIATGRSDYPNQINNAVVFPSIFRALLDLRIKNIDENILIAVAQSIADLVDLKQLKEDYIIPKINDPRILPIVTKSIKEYILSQGNNQ
ncbi:MAG TPA: NADP-dependent malic enzyme [Bacillales bacterium]|nr:NADP-dependent malic enzyme [Bacillales bacterium]